MKLTICVIMFFMLSLFLFLSACMQYSNTQIVNEKLCCKWIWKSSSGGLTGHQLITPETVGHTKVIQFSRNGEFREFHNDSLVISTAYTIVKKQTIFGNGRDVICFSDSTGQMMDQVIMTLSETELSLADPCPDCYGHAYVRME